MNQHHEPNQPAACIATATAIAKNTLQIQDDHGCSILARDSPVIFFRD